jgi:hypothetical protein
VVKQYQQRTVKHLTDENNEKIVHVPLDDRNKRYAIVNELVFEDLVDMGVPTIWKLKNDRGRDRVCFWNTAAKQDTAVSRLILDAGPGQAVVHANGNPFDLRIRNLVLGAGKGIRRDMDTIRPTQRINYKSLVKHEYEQQQQQGIT